MSPWRWVCLHATWQQMKDLDRRWIDSWISWSLANGRTTANSRASACARFDWRGQIGLWSHSKFSKNMFSKCHIMSRAPGKATRARPTTWFGISGGATRAKFCPHSASPRERDCQRIKECFGALRQDWVKKSKFVCLRSMLDSGL